MEGVGNASRNSTQYENELFMGLLFLSEMVKWNTNKIESIFNLEVVYLCGRAMRFFSTELLYSNWVNEFMQDIKMHSTDSSDNRYIHKQRIQLSKIELLYKAVVIGFNISIEHASLSKCEIVV